MNVFVLLAHKVCLARHADVVHQDTYVNVLELLFKHLLKVCCLDSLAKVKLDHAGFDTLALSGLNLLNGFCAFV